MIWKRRKDKNGGRDDRLHNRREDKAKLWNARAGCFKWLALCAVAVIILVYGFKAGFLTSLLKMFG
jgi:hypothetical protein